MRVKLTAFVISGAITAMIGAVWFYYLEQVQPQTGFNPLFDLTLVLMVFLGGYGSISGAVLGALIIEPLYALDEHPARVQRIAQRGRARRDLPPRRAVHAARHRPDRRRVHHQAQDEGPSRGHPGDHDRPGVVHAVRSARQLRRCPVTALLRTEGIMKAYGGVQALNGAAIAVEEGTVAGLIGPNGSGKTTLFNVITGYERPDAGEVWFGDRAITRLAPDKVFAAGIGRTFQLTRIFPRLTVIENMLIAAQAKDRPKNLLAWFGRDAWTPSPQARDGTA